MKKIYKNELKDLFGKAEYNWKRSGSTRFKKGTGLTLLLITRVTDSGLNYFVRVRLHQQAEAFGLDIGWSTDMMLPSPDYANPVYLDFMGKAKELRKYMISLPLIVEGNDRFWYTIDPEECLDDPMLIVREHSKEEVSVRTNACFLEAMAMINQKGIPYLESVNP